MQVWAWDGRVTILLQQRSPASDAYGSLQGCKAALPAITLIRSCCVAAGNCGFARAVQRVGDSTLPRSMETRGRRGRTLSASSFWTAESFSDLTPKRPFTDAAAFVSFARSRITCDSAGPVVLTLRRGT